MAGAPGGRGDLKLIKSQTLSDLRDCSLQLTLETHSTIFQKWACIFLLFHAVVLLAASN